MREELAAGNLFQRSRMENRIHTVNCSVNGTTITHISDIVSGPVITQIVSERILLFFVARNYSDFFNTVINKIPQHGLPKGSLCHRLSKHVLVFRASYLPSLFP